MGAPLGNEAAGGEAGAGRHCSIGLVQGRLALLLGGAAGNVSDRILHGGVTDFFEVWFGSYRYPAFNVADSAITIGAVLILLDVLFPRRSVSKAQGK